MPDSTLTLATFTAMTDENGRDVPRDSQTPVRVHFNPETLDITFTNKLKRGNRRQPAQVVDETTAKMGMELVFDTTLTGNDVREETGAIAAMIDPVRRGRGAGSSRGGSGQTKVPAIVSFQWGTILFQGYIDTYRERIEFFSPEGVPLRAVVTLSITQQERSFTPEEAGSGRSGSRDTSRDNDPLVRQMDREGNMTRAAQSLGDPGGAGDLARANGVENLRHARVDAIAVDTGPVTFEAGLGTGAFVSADGSRISARFSGLANPGFRTGSRRGRARFSLGPKTGVGGDISLRANAGFSLGGAVGSGTGFKADVGLDADLEAGIQFEE